MSRQIPQIEESSKFNLITSIWIVPFIALIIAGWLAFQYFSELGPEIKISFPKNEGLVAGQSQVKFRNVPVGKVTKILITEDTQGVVVVVRMNKEAEGYMTEHAKFWIVKPEVGISGISGLDTLISGTYIDVFSEAGGTYKKNHIGLTQPYRNISGGEYFHLTSFNGDNVAVGTPIYYKNLKVGQVEYLYPSLDNKSIDILVFIDKKYVPYVHDDSRFWTKNMLNVDFSKGNLDFNVAPLHMMLQGGIVFSSSGEDKGNPVSLKHVFPLYKSKTEADSKRIVSDSTDIKKFMLHTQGSIANLKINSAVRYDGFDIGQVEDIQLSYDKITHHMLGKVLIELDTSLFKDPNDTDSTGEANLYQAVEEGLRAKISPLDPISGMLFVDLAFTHNEGNASIERGSQYALFPTASNADTSAMNSFSEILEKINRLPLDELFASVQKVVEKSEKPVANANLLLEDLQKTVKNINTLTSKQSFKVLPDELNKALKEMTRTLKSTQKVVKGYDSNSLVKQQLSQTLEVVTKTSQEMQLFLRMLNRKPNSLIFGDN
ncbi:MAG: MCE family protein [Sulfurovum sp.]|uniref:PqiB family protein n=1 Tax=Sulfurovum sp. TaxID=1969726 RepID=UPI002867B33A|nr:MlaD family protein [Sulfurovum sp.]MCO4845303.1 MCE family protein [Sulfurovum sp.]